MRPKYAGLLPPREGPQSGLSRQVCRGAAPRVRRATSSTSPAPPRTLRDPAQWHAFVDALFETDWVVYAKPAFGGRLRRAALSRALYPSRRDQQSSLARLRWRPRDLSLEGLRPRRSASHDDAHRDGVSATLRAARAAARLRAHSAVWLSRQSLSNRAPRARPTFCSRRTPPPADDRRRPRRRWACPRCGAPDDRRAHPHGARNSRRPLSASTPHDARARRHDRRRTSDVAAHAAVVVCSDRRPAEHLHRLRIPRRHATAPPACRIRSRADGRPRSGTSTARDPGLQLHSRPPRQRLPSSLVIESASASASRPARSLSRRGTSDER